MKIENKTPIAEEIIRNNPTGHGLFAGIGDNFNSVAQVICELMDDAVSNLRANSGDSELSMRVVLSLENLGDAVEITVTDGGSGIADLSSALTIACRDGAQTPHWPPATAVLTRSGASAPARRTTPRQTSTARSRRHIPWAHLNWTSP